MLSNVKFIAGIMVFILISGWVVHYNYLREENKRLEEEVEGAGKSIRILDMKAVSEEELRKAEGVRSYEIKNATDTDNDDVGNLLNRIVDDVDRVWQRTKAQAE